MRVDVQAWGSSFEQLAEQMRAMLDEMHGRGFFRSHAPHSWTPHLNIYETDERYIACVELAGMLREQIDIRADSGTLHIQGCRHKPGLPGPDEPQAAVAGVSVHVMEIDSGRFHRRLPLAPDVIVEAISAVYRNGYLWVFLPRAPRSEPRDST